MSIISLSTELAGDIAHLIRVGSLKVDGIVLRDLDGKIRYILRGFETLPNEFSQFSESLRSLSSAMTEQQILQVVAIAQNVAIAANLQRIERNLAQIDKRLNGIDQRLALVEIQSSLILDGMRSGPVARLKAAKTAAIIALRMSDDAALIGAAQSAEHAARDILDQAKHLVQREMDGLPVAVHFPQELADLVSSAMDATEVASAILVALNNPDLASQLLNETVTAIKQIRQRLAKCFSDPELMLRRTKLDAKNDTLQIEAGRQLREAIQRCEGRKLYIDFGLIGSDPQHKELEIAASQKEIGFQLVPESFVSGVIPSLEQ